MIGRILFTGVLAAGSLVFALPVWVASITAFIFAWHVVWHWHQARNQPVHFAHRRP